ncbi:MAG TPA: BCCT family transporter, partial [Candidatus Brachybacterium merdigallinarum]|nr:BCCT family transporter [Candidatus Brachybacterium merdigallinarum]
QFPATQLLSVLGIIVVAVFFITSSDSGSLVVDMLASGGHPNPPMWSRVLWALLEGVLAAALLLSGGLTSLQAGSLMTALPFSVILLLMCVALVKALSLDRAVLSEYERLDRIERLTDHITGEVGRTHASTDEIASLVDDRIDYRLTRTRGGIGRGGHRTRVEGSRSGPSAPSAPSADE